MYRLKNALQLLIILVLVIYIIYDRKDHDQPIPFQFDLNPRSLIYSFDLPKKLSFAGEEVPLHDIEVRERLDRELHVNTYWHSSTIFNMKRAARWLPRMEEILRENEIPEDFKYLAIIESGLLNVRSPKDAVGYWQILEATGKELGLEINNEVDERYDPIKSTVAASKYLKKAYERFGSYTSAAASYNMGMFGLHRRMVEQKASNYYDLLLNEETSRYLFRILALKEIMENPTRYGYIIAENHLYKEEPVKYITVENSISDLAAFAIEHDINYKILKRYNPWLRKNSLTINRPGKFYEIEIPLAYHHYDPYLEDTIHISKDSLRIDSIMDGQEEGL